MTPSSKDVADEQTTEGLQLGITVRRTQHLNLLEELRGVLEEDVVIRVGDMGIVVKG